MSLKASRVGLLLVAGLLILAPTLLLQSSDGDRAGATYSQGALRVTIPYRAPHSGAGQLSIDLLSPEDEVVGHAERRVEVDAGKARWQEELKLEKPPGFDEVVWHRLRYRFTYAGEKEAAVSGIESVSEILRMPVIHVMGQQTYLAGGSAALRVVVTDRNNETVGGTLRIVLQTGGKSQSLFTGRLNRRGAAEAQVRFPARLSGSYQLRYVADTAIGSAEFVQPVRLQDKVSILLTTEKPIYQPGQTIHVRALALDRADHQAAAARKLTFEVEDSRGNKVFKSATQTDQFGIASAEFALAEEVNLGTYHLRAAMDGGENTAELALNVERYVLPKFKVAVEFAGAVQHGYRPGDHVTGTVRANYFFGQPVEGELTVKASGMDVALFEAASAQGKTDSSGDYRFDLKLPSYFAGRPLDRGAARVLVEAMVKDPAGHSESRGEPITVSESPLILTVVPEGGALIPNLENQVFVLASYADGKPARADLTVAANGNPEQSVATDEGGVALIRLAAESNPGALRVEAKDREGNHVATSVALQTRGGAEQVLLRTERAVYRAGDRIALKVFATKQRGAVYLDVVKDRQTILTRDVDLVNGQAEFTLIATPEMAGTLDLNAYLFGGDARPVADHRLIFVQPADELKIEASTDRPAYKPRDEARVRFRVTNSRGEGVQAALGLQVVDEAVFALAEKQPGFAKVFFYLEQEVMKPRYEIHSIGMPEAIETGALAPRERAARALFAATEMVNANRFEGESGRTAPTAKYAAYMERYRTHFAADVSRMSADLARAYQRHGRDLTKAAGPAFRDPWDDNLRIEDVSWNGRKTYLMRSAGPDKRFDTADDLAVYVEPQTRRIVGPPVVGGGGTIELNIEHDRGANNGRTEITGTVEDGSGVGVPGAMVAARATATGAVRRARSDAKGRFTVSAVPAGDYQVAVSAPGFRVVSRDLVVAVRDRAVLAVKLDDGALADTVMVVAENAPVRIKVGGMVQMAGGVVGGVPGGVMGGIIGAPMQFALPPPAAAPRQFDAGRLIEKALPVAAPRVRSYFPEALYINPEIITDQNGAATIAIPMADSITTWRMAMMASTARGALGSGASSIKVFQDFFVDLDLPVTLTQGDRVSLPVAAYNYSGARGNVSLQLKQEDWFGLVDDSADKTVAVESGRVGGAQFTLEAKRIGKFKLTVSARLDRAHADIVVREIEVIPNGREQNVVFNGRLETAAAHDLSFPASAIPEAGKMFVRLYPGPLSQVMEGMDSLLRMPFGCFEQTSSATYPNVLALDYMKRTKKLTGEVHAKAEGFIANGYQRLLTFEVPGGGFSWFGQAPANKILTAYGLMEFSDMAKVHDVDARLIERTQQWIAGQQQQDGSWRPDTSFINEGATNRYNSNVLRITAYLAWSLENTGYKGPAVERARQYIGAHMDAKVDNYTLAVLANFAVDYGKDREFTRQAMQMLLDARTEKDDQAWWTAEETGVYATGESAAVETTGLAAQALLKWAGASATAGKALHYLAAKKDASGTWRTTQATIMALRALLLSTEKGSADVRGTVEVTLNGAPVERLSLTPENNDLLHQFVLKAADANHVGLRFTGTGSLAYQVVGRYFVPWSEKAPGEPLSIDVAYDRARLMQDDIATATATVRNNLPKSANLVMVDLGIPPGFGLLSEDLQEMQEKTAGRKGGRLEKFSLTATQAILYFDAIPAGETVTVKYRLRAKYPVRARTFRSRVYEYYDPDVSAVARPVQLEVGKRR
jgi:uncharacterized protein YfaS (alpha-2-macroglobulin family)